MSLLSRKRLNRMSAILAVDYRKIGILLGIDFERISIFFVTRWVNGRTTIYFAILNPKHSILSRDPDTPEYEWINYFEAIILPMFFPPWISNYIYISSQPKIIFAYTTHIHTRPMLFTQNGTGIEITDLLWKFSVRTNIYLQIRIKWKCF